MAGKAAARGAAGERPVQDAWEWACVLDFLRVFAPQVGLPPTFRAAGVLRALENEPLHADLADLHITLLRGIHPKARRPACSQSWLRLLADKMAAHWGANCGADEPNPFAPGKGGEEQAYCAMSPVGRLRVLRVLCEVRAGCKDAQERLGEATANTKQPKKALKNKGDRDVLEWLDDFRHRPLGTDGQDSNYWLVRLPGLSGFGLFKEGPPKRRSTKKGKFAPPPKQRAWECVVGVGSSVTELEALATELCSRHNRWAQKTGGLLNEIIYKITDEAARAERRQRAAQTAGLDASLIITEGRRSRRERKRVNYAEADAEVDALIRKSERGPGREKRKQQLLRRAEREERLAAEAAARTIDPAWAVSAGMRRGRSAGPAVARELPTKRQAVEVVQLPESEEEEEDEAVEATPGPSASLKVRLKAAGPGNGFEVASPGGKPKIAITDYYPKSPPPLPSSSPDEEQVAKRKRAAFRMLLGGSNDRAACVSLSSSDAISDGDADWAVGAVEEEEPVSIEDPISELS